MKKSIKILNVRFWIVTDIIKKASRISRKQERQEKKKKTEKKKLRKTPIEYLTAVHARLVNKLSAEFQRRVQQCMHNTKVVLSLLTSKLVRTDN